MMFKWKLVYWNGDTFTDLDGKPHESPIQGLLFVVQPGKKNEIEVNADWFMWRIDQEEWVPCGADGWADHAMLFGHLIGCWRKTLWIRRPDWEELWERERKELDALNG